MMANARKHVTPDGDDVSVSRSTIFDTFGQSIHDVVPVANVTERSQLVADLITEGVGPSSTNPLVVYRSDAPGMHRVESTVDGTVWVPASGKPTFASKAAADSWGTSNPGYLSVNDRCLVGSDEYTWSGSAWFGPGAITASGGITWSINKLYRSGNIVTIQGYASKATDFATSEIVGTIPAGFRPTSDWGSTSLHYTAGFGPTANFAQVAAAGEIRVNVSGAAGMRYAFVVGSWMAS